MTPKPNPRKTPISAPFWEGCNDGRLMLQRCAGADCERYVYYPRACCPHCGSGDLDWVEASGRGRVVSWTMVHRPHHAGFGPEAPYAFLAVALAEGPLMYSRLAGDGAGGSDRPFRSRGVRRSRPGAEGGRSSSPRTTESRSSPDAADVSAAAAAETVRQPQAVDRRAGLRPVSDHLTPEAAIAGNRASGRTAEPEKTPAPKNRRPQYGSLVAAPLETAANGGRKVAIAARPSALHLSDPSRYISI